MFTNLAELPVVDVRGLVDPIGIGGVQDGREARWMLRMILTAWRVVGGELCSSPLSVVGGVSDRELQELQESSPPGEVVRIRARVGGCEADGYRALLEEFVGLDSTDEELNQRAEEMRKPVLFEDEVFGKFTLNIRYDSFEALAVWKGKVVVLSLPDSARVGEAIEAARQLFREQKSWEMRIRDYAALQFLSNRKTKLLDDDGSEVTAEGFNERLVLETITVDADGWFGFWHDDGGLFSGNPIVIGGNLLEGPTYTDNLG